MNSVSKVDADSNVAPATPTGGGFSKETLASTNTAAWVKAAPPGHCLKARQIISFLDVHEAFQAAAPALELRISPSKSVCGPL